MCVILIQIIEYLKRSIFGKKLDVLKIENIVALLLNTFDQLYEYLFLTKDFTIFFTFLFT